MSGVKLMEKFNRTLRGYDPEEVNSFLDNVIKQVEQMLKEMDDKDREIMDLRHLREENRILREKISDYRKMEDTMNKTIFVAQKTSDQMRLDASRERDLIIKDAKNNADRILNEALIKAEKTQKEAMQLKRNIIIFKRKIKDIVEAQLDVVNEIDRIDLE